VTTQTVTVSINGDTVNEPDETVRLLLSNPTNARLQNQEGVGTILNDDAPPAALFAATFAGSLYKINPTTAASTLVGSTGHFALHDITTDGNGQLIGYSQNGPELFSINKNTGSGTNIAPVGNTLAGFIEGDMAFDATSNSIFYVGDNIGNPHLYRIGPANGAVTDVGNITVGGTNIAATNDAPEMDYLAFRQGQVYCVIAGGLSGANANFNDALFKIDPATGAATLVGPLGVNLTPLAGGLDYDSATDSFVLIEGISANLYRVNATTGAATLIGNTGLPAGFIDAATGLSFTQVQSQAPRSISVGDVSITEGNQGTSVATFTVTAQAGNGPVTLDYSTVDGTATAGTALSGGDYLATSGSLTTDERGRCRRCEGFGHRHDPE
jgi:hypothetical protein